LGPLNKLFIHNDKMRHMGDLEFKLNSTDIHQNSEIIWYN